MTDKQNVREALRGLLAFFAPGSHWLREPGGDSWHVKRPLSAADLDKHLGAGPWVGAGFIAPGENSTRVAVLDLDSHGGETPWGEMQAAAARVVDALRGQGGEPVAFRSSGGRGIHLYCLWEQPQDAYSVRQWLRAALESAGFSNGTAGVHAGQIEAFPKNDSVAVGRFGNMVVVPLAGKSVPLDPIDLDDCPRDYIVGMDWPMSRPVPVLEKPERGTALVPAGDADLATLQSALAAIPNDTDPLDYDAWRDIIFGIHHATGGSDVGLELAHTFSARSPKYDPDFLDNRVWPYIDSMRGDAVTVRTVLHRARQAGWREPAELVAADFDVVPAPKDDKGEALPPLPNFGRDGKDAILATVENVVKALRAPYVCMSHIAHDQFKDELVIAQLGTEDWRPLTDADMVRLRIVLERGGFKPVGRELMRDGVAVVSDDNRMDSAQLWLRGLQWDGTPRVTRFLADYMGVEDTPYTRAVSRYMWTALAGRVLEPGVKADGVPIIEGAQGIGKSSAVAALVPAPDFYAEVSFAEKPDDLARKMRGVLVAEIGELSGLHTRELEDIKAFVSRTHEKWTPKYREFQTTFARRLLFFGTTNRRDILADETGNRRWFPVRATAIDLAAIKADRLHLWAEGATLFASHGVLYREASNLADGAHDAYRKVDAWEEPIRAWLEASPDFDEGDGGAGPRWESPFTTMQVLTGALHMHARDVQPFVQKRVVAILRGFGFDNKTVRINKQAVWGWRASETCKFSQVHDDLV